MFTKAYADILPIQGTEVAARWDGLWNFVTNLSIFFFVLVIGAMIYFAIRYRMKPGARAKYIPGSHLFEAVGFFVPTVLLLGIFAWGYSVYNDMTQFPSDAMEIRVVGRQWSWQFQYDDGRTTSNEVFVPVNKPVRLLMTAEDVLHSFFVPNFRIKQDVVPGMYTSVWFEANVPGRHQVYCTEFCGAAHSEMLAHIVVLEPEQWEAFQKGQDVGKIGRAGGGEMPQSVIQAEAMKKQNSASGGQLTGLAAQGQQIATKMGCVACHTTDGTTKIGPSWKGVFGSEREMKDGSKVAADENYMRESIENPQAKILKGFENMVMPPFKGMINEQDMNALIAYLKSLK